MHEHSNSSYRATSFTFTISMRQTRQKPKQEEYRTEHCETEKKTHTGRREAEGQELELQSNPSWDHYDKC